MIHYGLLLFFVLEYVRPTTYLPFLTPLHLYTIVPVFIAVASLFKGRVPAGEAADGNTFGIGFLLGLISLSVLTAVVTEYAFTKWTTVFGYALVYWVIVRQTDRVDQLKRIFAVMVGVHIVLAVLSPDMLLNADGRGYLTSGTFLSDGNDFALSLTVALPLCVFLYLDATKWWRRWFFLLALIFVIFCIVATKSRGGTIALACVGLYYWTKSAQKLRSTVVVAAAVVLILALAPPAYLTRMNTIGDTEESSAKGRIDAWKAAYQYAKDHPLLGIGAGHFNSTHGLTAHSIYFLILGELGFPGLFGLLFVIFYNFGANRLLAREIKARDPSGSQRELRLLTSVSAAMLAFATGGAFLSAVYYPHLYILAGLMSATRQTVRRAQARASADQPAPTPTRRPITYHWALQPSGGRTRIA